MDIELATKLITLIRNEQCEYVNTYFPHLALIPVSVHSFTPVVFCFARYDSLFCAVG